MQRGQRVHAADDDPILFGCEKAPQTNVGGRRARRQPPNEIELSGFEDLTGIKEDTVTSPLDLAAGIARNEMLTIDPGTPATFVDLDHSDGPIREFFEKADGAASIIVEIEIILYIRERVIERKSTTDQIVEDGRSRDPGTETPIGERYANRLRPAGEHFDVLSH
jgi:hypothetical protein